METSGHPTPNTAAAQTAAAQAAQADTATTQSKEAAGKAQENSSDSYTPPATQADLDRIIENRLARERQKVADYNELKAKAAKFDEAQEAKKTTEQKAAERIAALEKENQAFKLAEVKARIAAEHGISPDLLAGDSEESLAAQAGKIAEAIANASPKTAPRLPGEAAGTATPTSVNDWLRSQLQNKH